MRFRWSEEDKKQIPIEEWERKYGGKSRSGLTIMKDIEPYTSMIDGSLITSRSRHRAHLKEHNCIEIGNDSSLFRPKKPLEPPPGLKETINRAVDNVRKR